MKASFYRKRLFVFYWISQSPLFFYVSFLKNQLFRLYPNHINAFHCFLLLLLSVFLGNDYFFFNPLVSGFLQYKTGVYNLQIVTTTVFLSPKKIKYLTSVLQSLIHCYQLFLRIEYKLVVIRLYNFHSSSLLES